MVPSQKQSLHDSWMPLCAVSLSLCDWKKDKSYVQWVSIKQSSLEHYENYCCKKKQVLWTLWKLITDIHACCGLFSSSVFSLGHSISIVPASWGYFWYDQDMLVSQSHVRLVQVTWKYQNELWNKVFQNMMM